MASSIVVFLLYEIGAVILTMLITPGVKEECFGIYYFYLWFFLSDIIAKRKEWNFVLPLIIYASAGLTRFFLGKKYGVPEVEIILAMMVMAVLTLFFKGDGSCGGGGGGCGGCGG